MKANRALARDVDFLRMRMNGLSDGVSTYYLANDNIPILMSWLFSVRESAPLASLQLHLVRKTIIFSIFNSSNKKSCTVKYIEHIVLNKVTRLNWVGSASPHLSWRQFIRRCNKGRVWFSSWHSYTFSVKSETG